MRLKRALARRLGRLAFGAGMQRTLLAGRAVVVVFHRVDDRYPRDPITIGSAEFQAYCAFFAEYFQVCSLDTLIGALADGRSLDRKLVITFDDGYRDNHHVAAPILESFGLTACFFVTTSFIDSRTTPWWDREQEIESEWMTWDQVRDLAARGHEIGAHSVTHADLGKVEGPVAREEIFGSRRILQQRLGVPIRFFAYPYGRAAQLSEANRRLVVEAGYACCASSHGGLVTHDTSANRLPRVPVVTWFAGPGDFGLSLLRAR